MQRAQRVMRGAATAWFCVAAAGQLVFAAYIAVFYGSSTLAGEPERWNEVMTRGFVKDDTVFNWVMGLHLLMALAVMVGGLLQLLPRLRHRVPAFHRWNGRVYLLMALAMGLGGLSLIWIRGGSAGDVWQKSGTSFNALLIVWFVAMAWWEARARRTATHRRWALRLFLAVSGVWFFRIGLMLWLVINRGPVGFDPETFTGPALTGLAFAQTLLPLGALEIYLRAARSGHSVAPWAATGLLAMLTLATLAGISAATMILWLPHFLPASS